MTKRELGVYYSRIADWILPHLADRPLTLVRCPEGQAKQCFYQKHVNEHFPDVGPAGWTSARSRALRRHRLAGGPARRWSQMGVLELHIWGSHRDKIELPDYVVFDLDPDEGLDWERVVEGAVAGARLPGQLGLQTFLKTTGGKGLHVVLPLARRDDWDEVKAFTKAVAEAIVAAEPGPLHLEAAEGQPQGQDLHRLPAQRPRAPPRSRAYSTRSRPGAPVSTPLFWEELETDVRGNTYTVRTLPERLESLPCRSLGGLQQGAPIHHGGDEEGRGDEVARAAPNARAANPKKPRTRRLSPRLPSPRRRPASMPAGPRAPSLQHTSSRSTHEPQLERIR